MLENNQNILLPSLEKINHDHCYRRKSDDISDSEISVIANEPIQSSSMECIFIKPTIASEEAFLETEERNTLELTTRKQST